MLIWRAVGDEGAVLVLHEDVRKAPAVLAAVARLLETLGFSAFRDRPPPPDQLRSDVNPLPAASRHGRRRPHVRSADDRRHRRLEDDDLVAGPGMGQQGRGDGLGRAGGHHHAVERQVDSLQTGIVFDHRLAQDRIAPRRRILVRTVQQRLGRQATQRLRAGRIRKSLPRLIVPCRRARPDMVSKTVTGISANTGWALMTSTKPLHHQLASPTGEEPDALGFLSRASVDLDCERAAAHA